MEDDDLPKLDTIYSNGKYFEGDLAISRELIHYIITIVHVIILNMYIASFSRFSVKNSRRAWERG